ncbi:tetraacyldisaccharide 4'-kinase [Amorphus orientalis]|uniref:Tetraacyldisaccharide 4'-kinase n=1 Tax=Amorphus orientalis TaxID=649198 RepID=A0AAE4ASX2_9HYPH|nr:tetraacyldisaccharide 4'-kinase [Amorphus orientalis]MDQ0316721.1 tetraacyldisaccharide 4'-kinase [Amorphus orientalis]
MKRTAPAFWWREAPAGRWLAPLGWPVGFVAARRLGDRPRARLSIPVLCIGNPTVGGAGKTPTAIALAALLKADGRAPVFLLRGYGGLLKGPVRVDPARHSAVDVGDEALLLAAHAPTVVAADRVAGGRLAEEIGADVVVMDDGFQNPALHKDWSALVVDTSVGVGNGRVTPAGPLRAPLAPQLSRAQALVLIGDGRRADPVAAAAEAAGLAIFRARLAPQDPERFAGKRVLAFAGIGRPEKVAATLREAGAEVVRLAAYPDHHVYRDADARELLEEAARKDLVLVTTEKDIARLAGASGPCGELRAAAHAVRVTLAFEDPAALRLAYAGALRLGL